MARDGTYKDYHAVRSMNVIEGMRQDIRELQTELRASAKGLKKAKKMQAIDTVERIGAIMSTGAHEAANDFLTEWSNQFRSEMESEFCCLSLARAFLEKFKDAFEIAASKSNQVIIKHNLDIEEKIATAQIPVTPPKMKPTALRKRGSKIQTD